MGGGGGVYFQKKWVGVCGPLPNTLTLFMTKTLFQSCDIISSLVPTRLVNPLVEKQYQEYKMPVNYLANKSGYSFVQLYLPFVQKLCPHR